MRSILKFTLFPLLTILGVCALVLGILHVLLCMPFYFVGLGIIDGVFLLVLSFHGCLLSYPTRGHCFMQVCGSCLAIALAIMTILELLCVRPKGDDDEDDTIRGRERKLLFRSVCYGVYYRTSYIQGLCQNHMTGLTNSIIKLFSFVGELNTRRLVSGGLGALAMLQLLCTGATAWWCSIEAKSRPKGYHAQIALAIYITVIGCLHTVFCCMYFYVGFAIWGGALILVQAIITIESRGIGTLSRCVNLMGAGLGMSLSAINVFGLFCWFEGLSKDSDWAFRYHCQWRSDTYSQCEKRLEFSEPYLNWEPEVAKSEIRNFQFCSYSGLIIGGLLQLVISLHSMFRKIRH